MKTLTCVMILALTGACANPNTEKEFLCEAQQGSPCTTISAVDGTGVAGVTPVRERAEDTAMKSLAQEPLLAGKRALTGLPDGGFPYNAAAYRTPEVVGTLWIAPVLDEGGIMHEARFVHFLIREGQWRQ